MKFKKLFTAALAAVMTAAIFMTTASAAFSKSVPTTAKTIKSDKAVSDEIYNYAGTANYKLTVAKSGKLKLDVKTEMGTFFLYLFDSEGKAVAISDRKVKTGERGSDIGATQFYGHYDSDKKLFEGTLTYPVEKGVYYIQIGRGTSSGSGKYTLTASAPAEKSSDSSPILTLKAKKGDTIDLGVDDTEDSVTWSSSKKAVASVDKNGTVTAKKKGTAVITAKTGDKSLKVKIVVK